MKSSSNARRSMRLTAVAGAAAIAVSLSACGTSGLMHSGDTAGSFDGTTVTTTQVQSAVKQIGTVSQGFDGESATAFMLLLPKLEQIGQKYGIAVSEAQVRAMFPASMDLSSATVTTARGSVLFTKLAQNAQAQPAVAKLLKTADVQLNPRYGQWVKGKGPTQDLAPWIKSATKSTATATPKS
ncbi:hypothetical protein [Leekyejoonella antrihumi]|uniref:Uncharacterized protein n=1 Tax=Leekyejoonella antrihumi TaxID=1660198 RepID=A0A563DTB0_9MICO|nr:hypothetical protein [Leekyejoonella antrihumi]TWP33475.1 hypothetical protein FGL98_21185 [Leekyejoonella antrihumi]